MCCQFISTHTYQVTIVGRFMWIGLFNKIVLIFLGVFIVFHVPSFEFQLIMSGPEFTQPQSTGLSGFGAMLESYHKL